jgi:hypothetical protein
VPSPDVVRWLDKNLPGCKICVHMLQDLLLALLERRLKHAHTNTGGATARPARAVTYYPDSQQSTALINNVRRAHM